MEIGSNVLSTMASAPAFRMPRMGVYFIIPIITQAAAVNGYLVLIGLAAGPPDRVADYCDLIYFKNKMGFA